jgi:hypothetical protein
MTSLVTLPSWRVFDLVIKNFGRTPATDIWVTFEPELRRAASGEGELIELPEVIHVLVPGQEWRTLWDSQIDRRETELPSHHVATVTFRDSEGKRGFSSEFGLDWDVVARRDVVDVQGIPEAAKALAAISATLKSWRP